MIVIGVDVHKHSLTAVAVDETGRPLAERALQGAEEGLVAWASELDGERLWAVEDCRHVTGALERELVAAGERLLRGPPELTAPERRGGGGPHRARAGGGALGVPPKVPAREGRAGRARGKSDSIDALAAARASLREPRLHRPRGGGERLRGVEALVAH